MSLPITNLDTLFDDHLTALEEACAASANATCLSAQRKWYYPPLNSWSGDPFDIQGMNQAFDRAELNANYVEIISNADQEGKVGEAMVEKLQIDYTAAMERAFRTRHASSVRCRIHSAGRRAGMGDSSGVFHGSVAVWLNRLLFAAHDDPYA